MKLLLHRVGGSSGSENMSFLFNWHVKVTLVPVKISAKPVYAGEYSGVNTLGRCRPVKNARLVK